MTRSRPPSGTTQVAATVLALGLVGAVTGVLPMAGLTSNAHVASSITLGDALGAILLLVTLGLLALAATRPSAASIGGFIVAASLVAVLWIPAGPVVVAPKPVAAIAPLVEPVVTATQPVGSAPVVEPPPPVVDEPAPAIYGEDIRAERPVATWPQAAAEGLITVRTGASQTVLKRGGDGETWVVTTLEVQPDPAPAAPRPPIDLALVVDTSGSMSETHDGVQAMPLVRRATLGLIERLRPEDRLVLVTYSDDAVVRFQGPIGGEGHARLERIVADLEAAGGTNLHAGLVSGIAGLNALGAAPARDGAGLALGAPDAAPRDRRLILLTDGKPTVGRMTQARELTEFVATQRAGVPISTLGLGLAYNEDLLAAMADRGGGVYHHAARADGLTAIYEAELASLRRLAARSVELTLEAGPGVELVGVESWPTTTSSGATRVAIGDLTYGQKVKVVARLRAPTSGDAASLVCVRLEAPADRRGDLVRAELPLSIAVSDDPAVVEAGRVRALDEELGRIEVSRRLREARTAAASGDRERARQLLREAREVGGMDELRYDAPSGERRAVDLRRLEEALGHGDRDAMSGAMKVAAEADRAGAR